jgi:hypothetical protein
LNNLSNLGIKDQYAEALQQLGFDLEVLAEQVWFSRWSHNCIMDSALFKIVARE